MIYTITLSNYYFNYLEIYHMLAFFGQPIFRATSIDATPVGYELFIREKLGKNWVTPSSFNSIQSSDVEALLSNTIFHIDTQSLSINLEPCQFINLDFISMLTRIQQQTTIKLIVELTERSDDDIQLEDIVTAAKTYYQNNLHVSIDDIGTGANTAKLISRINNYIYEYKFAVQNFRPLYSLASITPVIDVWYDMKKRYNKKFTFEGIENRTEFNLLKAKYDFDTVQGYYTGKPELLSHSIIDRNIDYDKSV